MQNQELHRIVSTAIIVKDDKYLITKRSPQKKVFPNRWTVPGGGLETDDYIKTPPTTRTGHWYYALENSLRREVKEEVNLSIKKLNYLLDLVFIRPDKIPVITLSFWAFYKSGKVRLDDENVDYKWVSLEDAKKYDLIEGIWEEIQMVDKLLQGKNRDRIKYNSKK